MLFATSFLSHEGLVVKGKAASSGGLSLRRWPLLRVTAVASVHDIHHVRAPGDLVDDAPRHPHDLARRIPQLVAPAELEEIAPTGEGALPALVDDEYGAVPRPVGVAQQGPVPERDHAPGRVFPQEGRILDPNVIPPVAVVGVIDVGRGEGVLDSVPDAVDCRAAGRLEQVAGLQVPNPVVHALPDCGQVVEKGVAGTRRVVVHVGRPVHVAVPADDGRVVVAVLDLVQAFGLEAVVEQQPSQQLLQAQKRRRRRYAVVEITQHGDADGPGVHPLDVAALDFDAALPAFEDGPRRSDQVVVGDVAVPTLHLQLLDPVDPHVLIPAAQPLGPRVLRRRMVDERVRERPVGILAGGVAAQQRFGRRPAPARDDVRL